MKRRSLARRRSTASTCCAPRWPAETLDAAATVLAYKSLAHVERAFRSLKSIDLDIRPVHHRLAGRVRAHVFLRMLAYYVAWHMRRTLAPLLFRDDDKPTAQTARQSPVAPATPLPTQALKGRASAPRASTTCRLRSFEDFLLRDLATICLNQIQPADLPCPASALHHPRPSGRPSNTLGGSHRLGTA